MIDREKVVKGLECCEEGYCPACPYYSEDDDSGCEMYVDAITLLKAQEPVRPGVGIIHNDDGSKSYFLHCPIDGTTFDEGDKYCRKCGRAVKWG